MKTNTINGTYGSCKTPCTIFTCTDRNDNTWYAVEDSINVNCACFIDDTIPDGIDVETIHDNDFFTASTPIDSEETLQEQVEL